MTELHELRARLAPLLGDRLLAPADAEFAGASGLVFAGDGRAPALIARPVDTPEVSAVVTAARDLGVPLAVRSGGHSYGGWSAVDGGLTLDLRLLDDIGIDPERRVGSAAGGVTAGAYTAAAGEHGLATGFGDTATVGVSGLALGGGIGFLSRRDGLTIDNLLGVEVVLADGTVVETSASESPDLFWALRGGGGNFGVLTRLDFRLHDTAAVTGGMLAFAPSPTTVTALLDAAREAPDRVSLMINVMKAPPMPMIPADLHGTPIVVALVCFSGEPDAATSALRPFRDAGTVLVDLLRPMRYPEMFAGEAGMTGMRASLATGFGGLDEIAAAEAIARVGAAPTPMAVVNLRPMGGAIARVPADATAFAHRTETVMTSVAALAPAAMDAEPGREWSAATADQLGITDRGAYVNFVSTAEDSRLHAAYPEGTLRRLAEVKALYDPANVFRSNLNIEPAGVAARR